MEDELKSHLKKVVKNIYNYDLGAVYLEHPENGEFGDLATNLPLTLASQVKQPPMEIAKKLVYELDNYQLSFNFTEKKYQVFKKIEIASPGFINFTFSTEWLHNLLYMISQSKNVYGIEEKYNNKKIIIEYTDPNPFKVFHIGHVMTNAIGESLARIYQFLGAELARANYQGDVGLHVAKTLWGILQKMPDENLGLEDIEGKSLFEKISYLGSAYSLGAQKYLEDPKAKLEMDQINRLVYYIAQKYNQKVYHWQPIIDFEPFIKEIKDNFDFNLLTNLYELGRTWSLDYFETLYLRLGSKFDYYYLESMIAEEGLKIVRENMELFEKSEGAVVFRGEKYGLHTRVFVNSTGLPVYEAKDLGLAEVKYRDFSYDKSIIITANEVNEYFKVVLKALEEIDPDLAAKTVHIGHGMMNFAQGKMSSRTGDVIAGDELLNSLKARVLAKMGESETSKVVDSGDDKEKIADKIAVAALKYSILKSGIGRDIYYDEEKSIEIEGDTGSYLLYTYTRTNSVLEKAGKLPPFELNSDLHPLELDLLRHLYKFSEEILLAAERLSPNLIAGFIFTLAQKYNSLYAKLPIIKAKNSEKVMLRLYLTLAVNRTLREGLNLLGIEVVDKM
jgi:arginyl-tRNA synthetase